MTERLGISKRLSDYFSSKKRDTGLIEKEYELLEKREISYVNHTDHDFPLRLRDIPTPPYGLFVRGRLPDENTPSVAVIGSRQ